MKISRSYTRLFFTFVVLVVFSILVMAFLRDQGIKKEHFSCQDGCRIENNSGNYCNAMFTADGTELEITSITTLESLTADPTSAGPGNAYLMPTINAKNTLQSWRLLPAKAIECDPKKAASQKCYPDVTKKSSCATYIQTVPDKQGIGYYLTRPSKAMATQGVHVEVTGGGQNQMWYVLHLNRKVAQELGIESLLKQATNIYLERCKKTPQFCKSKGDFYLILSDLNAFSQGKSLFLTAHSQSARSELQLTLEDHPSAAAIWQFCCTSVGKLSSLQPFKAYEAVGDFPAIPMNRRQQNEGAMLSERQREYPFGPYMNQFNTFWNRRWYARGNRGGSLATIDIEMGKRLPGKAYAKGILKLGFENVNEGKKYPDQMEIPLESYSSDLLFGSKRQTDGSGLDVTLQAIPEQEKPQGVTTGVPLMKGWFRRYTLENGKLQVRLESICAGDDPDNLASICMAILPTMNYQKWLQALDRTPMNPENNWNLNKGMADSILVKRPVFNNITDLNPDNERLWMDVWKGMDPMAIEGNILKIVPGIGSINDAVRTAWLCMRSTDCRGADRVAFYPNARTKGSNQVTGIAVLGDTGYWGTALDQTLTDPITGEQYDVEGKDALGTIMRTPLLRVSQENKKKYSMLGSNMRAVKDNKRIGTIIKGGETLSESFTQRENFVGNINKCLEQCDGDLACEQVQYAGATKDCMLKRKGTAQNVIGDLEWNVSFASQKKKNQLSIENQLHFQNLPDGTSLTQVHASLAKPPMKVDSVNECAQKCLSGCENQSCPDCFGYTFDAEKRECSLLNMGTKTRDPNAPMFSGIRRNFVPKLRDSLQHYTAYPAKSYAGTMVPNLESQKRVWVPTAETCAQECSKNKYCSIAHYNSKDWTCDQFLDDLNYSDKLVPGKQSELVFRKKPDPRAVFVQNPNKVSYHPPVKGHTIIGGIEIEKKSLPETERKLTSSKSPLDSCADLCRQNISKGCDGFTYDLGSGECTLYDMGNCADPKAPDCGYFSTSDNPELYASRTSVAEEKKEFKTVTNNTKYCPCDKYCQKNWGGEMKGWTNAKCARAFEQLPNGDQREVGCNTVSKENPLQCRCYQVPGKFGYKDQSKYFKGRDCHESIYSRFVYGDGTCSGNDVCRKNIGNVLGPNAENQTEDWKGAYCANAGAVMIDKDGNRKAYSVPCDKALREVANPDAPQFYAQCIRDFRKPFAPNNGKCSKEYVCVIL